MKPIIKIENVSKQYRLGNIGTGTLSNDLKRWSYRIRGKEDPFLKIGESNDRSTKGNSNYIWALKDINFEVMPGEVLGIIGKNGAGKSTLLKILSKVTGPTTGSINYDGRIGSLLEVGTGFHPELTGRENVFLNGAILGMNKQEIRSKLDEIIDFSGCERYIDTPVKRYSSGMKVRLGFAVAAHLEPEILVVDEVLAVGDAEFQKKAIGKMQDVSRNDGRTVLFVSHNMSAVQNLCTRGVILENGQVSCEGNIGEVMDRYLHVGDVASKISFEAKTNIKPYVSSIELLDPISLKPKSSFMMGEDILMEFIIVAHQNVDDVNLNVRLNDSNLTKIAAWRTLESGVFLSLEKGINKISLKVSKLNVFNGLYNLSFALFDSRKRFDDADNILNFEIVPAKIEYYPNVVNKYNNVIYTPCNWIV